MRACALHFGRHEGGATAIEYALIASIVSIALAASLTSLSGSLETLWQSISDAFP